MVRVASEGVLVDAQEGRTIANSGSSSVEAGDGLPRAEGAGLGSQGHGHPEGKPSFQPQGVQRGVDQGGVYLTQSRTAQGVDVLIPTAVPGCPRGRLFTWCRLFGALQWLRNPRSSSSGPHRRELRLVSRYQRSRLTSPVAMSTASFSTIAPCLAPGKPNSSRI